MNDTERPTREQVDEALRMANDTAFTRSKQHPVNVLVAELLALRAVLAARTPQPAEVLCSWCGLAVPVGADGLLTEHKDPAISDSGRLCGATGSDQYEPLAPLPAVPDGEDAAACMNCGLPLGPPEAWDHAQIGPVHHGCPDDAEDGEDVPARLDAVRRWVREVQATDWTVLPDSAVPAFAAAVRDVARIVDEPWDVAAAALSDDPAALRAAVAAALARPSGDPS